jgi:hypothetical protein
MLTSTQQNGNLKNMGIFPLDKKLNSQVWVPHSGVEQQKTPTRRTLLVFDGLVDRQWSHVFHALGTTKVNTKYTHSP